MPSALGLSDPRRGQLVSELRRGNVYGFLNAVEPYLRELPQDSELRGLAVQACGALGLGTMVKRLLEDPACDAEVRARLTSQPGPSEECIAWSKLDGQFRANLTLFDQRTGLGEELSRVWRASRGRLQLIRAKDGNPQVFSRLPDLPGWLPGLAPHAQLASAAQLKSEWQQRVIRPLALHGLGLGYAVRAIHEASQKTFLEFSTALLVVEPSLLAWAVVLHLHDWRELLADPRLRLCAGPEALRQFEQELEDVDRALPVVITTPPRWPASPPAAEISSRIEAARARRAEQQSRLFAEVSQRFAGRDRAWWADRLAGAGQSGSPLTVMGVTSRNTTVLQYSMRDLLTTFERLGHRTHLFIERDNHSHFSPPRVLSEIGQVQPDLIVMLDHLQHEFKEVFPEHIPSICWIQDRLPHLFRREAGRAVRPLEFVIGYGTGDLLVDFDYPADRFYPCPIPTNPEKFAARDEREEDLAPYRCDVMYATHAPPLWSADERFQQFRQQLDPADLPVLDAAYETLAAAWRRPDFCGEYDFNALMTRTEQQVGRSVGNPAARAAAVGTLRDLTDHELRQAAIRALARWADQTGRRFHLYGNGWDKHDEFGRFARGTVKHGPELGRAFRAATISLHTGCNSAAHQRVIDGLCAGGFMLIRDEPTQRLREMWQAIHACVRRDRSVTAVMPDMLPPELAPKLREFLTACGHGPDDGLPVDRKLRIGLRARFDLNWIQTPADVWPHLARVTFRNQEHLLERVDYYLEHEQERRELAAEMRAQALEHYTYEALVRRVLDFMRENLAGRGVSLADC